MFDAPLSVSLSASFSRIANPTLIFPTGDSSSPDADAGCPLATPSATSSSVASSIEDLNREMCVRKFTSLSHASCSPSRLLLCCRLNSDSFALSLSKSSRKFSNCTSSSAADSSNTMVIDTLFTA